MGEQFKMKHRGGCCQKNLKTKILVKHERVKIFPESIFPTTTVFGLCGTTVGIQVLHCGPCQPIAFMMQPSAQCFCTEYRQFIMP